MSMSFVVSVSFTERDETADVVNIKTVDIYRNKIRWGCLHDPRMPGSD
jgi:hypothetical protein